MADDDPKEPPPQPPPPPPEDDRPSGYYKGGYPTSPTNWPPAQDEDKIEGERDA